MEDHKTRLTQDFIENLPPHFCTADLTLITESLTKVLASYDVKEQSTAVSIHDDKNDRFLKRYAACLSVDGKSKKTTKMYVQRLKAFSDFIGIPFDKVGTYDIRFYLASMKEKGVSGRTLENYRSYISAFYQWMSKEDIIVKNPCDKIPPIKYKEEVRSAFSDIEIDSLRSACKTERQRAMVEILLSSGVRVEELCNINLDDIDMANLSIRIREGKGSKERTVYITDVCAIHIRRYLLSRGGNASPCLFISEKKKERLTPGGARHILKRISKSAGVDNVHPHRFRRTFATNLSKRGMDIQTIARLMGHSNIQTTMVYVAMDESRVNNEYRKYTA